MKTLIRLVILLLALSSAWLIREQLLDSSHRRLEEYQWVKLIDEPPPKKLEKPPEPEPIPEDPDQEMDELKMEEVTNEPVEAEPSADDALGVDEEGRAGADSFGLRSKKGGKDLLQSGPQLSSPSGHRGHVFLAYGSSIISQLESHLMMDSKLREQHYVIVVRVWISPAGKISRCEVDQSSGNRAIDDRLTRLIASFSGHLPHPPAGMHQPIKIRIRSTITRTRHEPGRPGKDRYHARTLFRPVSSG
ncbi:MAG: TonB C-terminal domain-containing protein [Methylococcaceae bacterium]|nr:TonB C-terminal domain-containing protein [Methylococcaceae bacterium]